MNYDNLPHFLQSPAWASFQAALGKPVLTASGEGWSYLAIVEKSHGIKRLYCPYGPTANSAVALSSALDSLRAQAKSHGAAYVRLQPLGTPISPQLSKKYQLSPITYSQPSDTWTVDLTQPVDELLANMKQATRNVIRNYHKKGLTYRQSQDPDDIHLLLRLLSQVASHNQISIHSDQYLITQARVLLSADAATLHFIDYQSEPIAAALTYHNETTTYYAHAAADYAHRNLNASTALVGEIMLHAKSTNRTLFDLFGITTSTDPAHKWAGFTRFKQSFGGQHAHLSQTYELPVNHLVFRLYSLLKKLR